MPIRPISNMDSKVKESCERLLGLMNPRAIFDVTSYEAQLKKNREMADKLDTKMFKVGALEQPLGLEKTVTELDEKYYADLRKPIGKDGQEQDIPAYTNEMDNISAFLDTVTEEQKGYAEAQRLKECLMTFKDLQDQLTEISNLNGDAIGTYPDTPDIAKKLNHLVGDEENGIGMTQLLNNFNKATNFKYIKTNSVKSLSAVARTTEKMSMEAEIAYMDNIQRAYDRRQDEAKVLISNRDNLDKFLTEVKKVGEKHVLSAPEACGDKIEEIKQKGKDYTLWIEETQAELDKTQNAITEKIRRQNTLGTAQDSAGKKGEELKNERKRLEDENGRLLAENQQLRSNIGLANTAQGEVSSEKVAQYVGDYSPELLNSMLAKLNQQAAATKQAYMAKYPVVAKPKTNEEKIGSRIHENERISKVIRDFKTNMDMGLITPERLAMLTEKKAAAKFNADLKAHYDKVQKYKKNGDDKKGRPEPKEPENADLAKFTNAMLLYSRDVEGKGGKAYLGDFQAVEQSASRRREGVHGFWDRYNELLAIENKIFAVGELSPATAEKERKIYVTSVNSTMKKDMPIDEFMTLEHYGLLHSGRHRDFSQEYGGLDKDDIKKYRGCQKAVKSYFVANGMDEDECYNSVTVMAHKEQIEKYIYDMSLKSGYKKLIDDADSQMMQKNYEVSKEYGAWKETEKAAAEIKVALEMQRKAEKTALKGKTANKKSREDIEREVAIEKKIDDNTKKIDENNGSIKTINDQLVKMDKEYEKNGKEIGKLAGDIESLGKKKGELNSKLEEYTAQREAYIGKNSLLTKYEEYDAAIKKYKAERSKVESARNNYKSKYPRDIDAAVDSRYQRMQKKLQEFADRAKDKQGWHSNTDEFDNMVNAVTNALNYSAEKKELLPVNREEFAAKLREVSANAKTYLEKKAGETMVWGTERRFTRLQYARELVEWADQAANNITVDKTLNTQKSAESSESIVKDPNFAKVIDQNYKNIPDYFKKKSNEYPETREKQLNKITKLADTADDVVKKAQKQQGDSLFTKLGKFFGFFKQNGTKTTYADEIKTSPDDTDLKTAVADLAKLDKEHEKITEVKELGKKYETHKKMREEQKNLDKLGENLDGFKVDLKPMEMPQKKAPQKKL